MNWKIANILFIFIIFFNQILFADDLSSKTEFDIPACIELALKNNRKIVIEKEKIIEAQQKIEEVKSNFYPNVSASFLYTRLEKAPSIDFGGRKTKIGDENTYSTKLQILYPLYTAGATKIGTELTELGLETNELNAKITNLEIIYSIHLSFYNVLKANKFIEIANESINLLKAHEKNVQELYLYEITTKSDLLSIQLKLREAEQILLKTQNGMKLIKTTFNQQIGIDIDSTLILKDIQKYEDFTLKIDECLEVAKKNRNEIKILEKNIKINEKKKDLTATENKPKVSVIGAYNIDEGGLSSDKKWTVSLSAAIPIWDHDKTKHKISQDQSKIEQTRLQLLEMIDAITLQVKQAYLNVESIKKELETYQFAIEQAKENYKIAEDKYKENLVTDLEVFDAHSMLIRTNINYYSTIYDYELAVITLKKVMGTL